jgi:hypothetical protein
VDGTSNGEILAVVGGFTFPARTLIFPGVFWASRAQPKTKKSSPKAASSSDPETSWILVRQLRPMKPESTEPNNHTADGKGTGESFNVTVSCSGVLIPIQFRIAIVEHRRVFRITQTG